MATPSKKPSGRASGGSGSGSRREPATRAEELQSTATGTTLINGTTFAGKQLTYAKVGELAIFEGDIVLGRHADMVATADRSSDVAFSVAITGSHLRWPNATVPYEIDPAMPDQFRVTDAMAHWVTNTSIRFVERTPANAGTFPNYVHFFAGNGCFSTVGMVGGRQDISLGGGCSTGNAIHEIGHTIGLWHEQSREDRDSFVSINFANIDPAMVHNFDQHISDGDDIGAYDYGSIMHYPANAFSTNGQPTIVPVQAGVAIGQRTGLSAGDIAGVRQLYPSLVPFKKLRDDIGPKQFLDPQKRFLDPQKRFLDPQPKQFLDPQPKQFLDPQPKQFLDPQPKQFLDPQKRFLDPPKQLLDPPKQVFDPGQKGFDVPTGPGPQVVNPMGLASAVGPGDLPFILANPHHAESAQAYEGGYDPTLALLASAAAAAAAAAQSMAEVAALLNALVYGDGQGAAGA